MKSVFVGLSVLSLAVLAGCDSGSSGPSNKVGGPGASGPGASHALSVGQEDNTFKLSTPTLATDIKQGEEKSVDIEIKRGKGFDQDVPLSFDNEDGKKLPSGLSISPEKPVIKKGDDKTSIKVKAADDAAIGDFKLTVTGKPASGSPASATLKIDVKKK